MELIDDGETVVFMLEAEHFRKAMDGRKNNTVRKFLFEEEEARLVSAIFGLSKIEIREKDTTRKFRRVLSDITLWPTFGERIYIFSWLPGVGAFLPEEW
jgi:hypothetical protein